MRPILTHRLCFPPGYPARRSDWLLRGVPGLFGASMSGVSNPLFPDSPIETVEPERLIAHGATRRNECQVEV